MELCLFHPVLTYNDNDSICLMIVYSKFLFPLIQLCTCEVNFRVLLHLLFSYV